MATTAAGKFGDNLRIQSDALNSVGVSENPIKFPYSIFITGLGGLIGMIVFLVLLASKPWQIATENQQGAAQAPQVVTYPQSQFTNVQTAYPPGQPQMYAMHAPSAPPTNQGEKGYAAPSYY